MLKNHLQLYHDFEKKLSRTEINLKRLQRTIRPLFTSRILGNQIFITSKLTKKSLKITFDNILSYAYVTANGYHYSLYSPDTKTLFNRLIKHNLL